MNVMCRFDRSQNHQAVFFTCDAVDFVARSYFELLDNSAALSAALSKFGIGEGSRVVLLLVNCIEFIESTFAILNLGAIVVPIHPAVSNELFGEIVEDVEPDCFITHSSIDGGKIDIVTRTTKPLVVTEAVDGLSSELVHTYCELVKQDRRLPVPKDVELDAPAFIFYTSGTSGRSKAIVSTHGKTSAILDYFEHYYEQICPLSDDANPEARDSHIATLPLCHMSSLASCFARLRMRTPVYLLRNINLRVYLDLLVKLQCSHIMLVSSMYEGLLLELKGRSWTELSFVRIAALVGEAGIASLLHKLSILPNAVVLNPYGLTECVSGIGYLKSDILEGLVKSESCGKHYYGEVKLIDPQGKEHEKRGELLVRNATVTTCYLDESLNASRIVDGWFRTGDVFYKDDEGYYYYQGRVDDMFTHNGNNIFPTAIENILKKNTDLREVCIVAIRDARGYRVPAALVVASNANYLRSDFLEYCVKKCPPHAVPRHVVFAEEIPKLGAGKISRAQVTEIVQGSYDQEVTSKY